MPTLAQQRGGVGLPSGRNRFDALQPGDPVDERSLIAIGVHRRQRRCIEHVCEYSGSVGQFAGMPRDLPKHIPYARRYAILCKCPLESRQRGS
jgi:hypothetical protein